jgi:Holliday junction DNA helicase RuvB
MRGENPYLRDDSRFEDSLRPQRFQDFIGQRKCLNNLDIAIQAANKRKETLDHILFSGLPGLGKTTLARIIAHEMKAPLTITSGPVLKRPGDLAGTMTKLEEGAILFIDEIHRMLPDVEEYLYTAMEDFFITINVDAGPQGRTINLPLKKFTLVGATTREGLLTDPFRARFGILEKLEWYPVDDLVEILFRSARILSIDLDKKSARIIAERSRGTPRIANRYLRRVRDLAEVKTKGKISEKIAREGLKMLGVDTLGLELIDRKILTTLLRNPTPVGIKTLSVAVGEEEQTIEEVYEPFLIQNDFLVRTPRGRKATEKASRHMGESCEHQESLF